MFLPLPFTYVSKSAAVFIGVFAGSFIFLALYWFQMDSLLDDVQWMPAMEEVLSQGFPAFREHVPGAPAGYFYAYPGTTILYPGALLLSLGFSADFALRFLLAFFVALGITITAWLCYRLRPESLWWVGAWGLLIFNSAYYAATPPTSVIIPLTSSLTLLTLLIREQQARNAWLLVLLGLLTGFALGTRFDISALTALICFLYLRFTIGTRAWIVLVFSLLSFTLANPYVVFLASEYAAATAGSILFHATTTQGGLPLVDVYAKAPLGVAGLLLGTIAIFLPSWLHTLPRGYLVVWVIATLALFTSLNVSEFHPARYFAPFFAVWTVFLPYFLITVVRGATLSPEYPNLTHWHLEVATLSLLVTLQYASFMHLM